MRRFSSTSTVRHLLTGAAGALMPKRSLPGAPRLGERGNVAIMTAALAAPLIGFSALAVDVGVWEVNKSAMQGAADQAALAAGLAMPAGMDAARKEAKGLAAAHGFADGVGGVSVTLAPATGSYAGSPGAIEVVIRQPQQAFLSGMILNAAPTASARAVVAPGAAAGQASTCIMALAPTGRSITGSGLSTIDSGTCNIYVNSPSDCAVTLSGSTVIKGYDVFLGQKSQSGCTSGSAKVSATNNLQHSSSPAADPYKDRQIPTPASPCTPPDVKKNPINLTPGTYCGLSLSGTKTVNLASGVYIFDDGGITRSGSTTINGTDVTLIFTSSRNSSYAGIQSSGTFNLNLTPMKSGPTAGIAIWLDKRARGSLDFSGSPNLNITGAVYAPGSDVNWSGNGNSPCTQLIANTITLSGSSKFKHDCTGLGVADVGSVGVGGYKLKE